MRYVTVSVVVACLLIVAAAQQPSSNEPRATPPLPPGEGRDLVQTGCVGCHNMKMIFQSRKTQAAWAKDVNDMIQRGAQIFPDEIGPITSYLSKNFGPDTPPLVNVNTATPEQLETLPGVTPDLAERIVTARSKSGAFKNPEDLRRALGLNEDEFAKEFYLLTYN